MIHPSVICAIKEAPPTEAICREIGLVLHGRGRKRKCRCPFHAERTASFGIDLTSGLFHCFGCGASGDILKLIQQVTGRTFPEAVELACKLSGVALVRVEGNDSDGEEAIKRKAVTSIYTAIQRINPDKFACVELGSDMDEPLHILGLDDTKRKYLAIRSLSGSPVAIAGRRLDDGKERKWMNSEFKKGAYLYGYWETLRAPGDLYLVEGYADVHAIAALGVGACALMGTEMTDQQLNVLSKDKRRLVVCMDGDAPGASAALEISKRLMLNHIEHWVHILTDGDDPGSAGLAGSEVHWTTFLAPHYVVPLVNGHNVDAPLRLRKAVAALLEADCSREAAESVLALPKAKAKAPMDSMGPVESRRSYACRMAAYHNLSDFLPSDMDGTEVKFMVEMTDMLGDACSAEEALQING